MVSGGRWCRAGGGETPRPLGRSLNLQGKGPEETPQAPAPVERRKRVQQVCEKLSSPPAQRPPKHTLSCWRQTWAASVDDGV